MNISTDEELTFNMHRNTSSSSQNESFVSHLSTILIPPKPRINITSSYLLSDESENEFSGFSSSEIPSSPLYQENKVNDNLDGILYNVMGTNKKVEVMFTSRELFNEFMEALEKEISPKLNSSNNVQYTVHVQGKMCIINIQKNRLTIVLTGPGNILWRDSTFRRLSASIYDQQFELTSTPTGPRRMLNKTPLLSPIKHQTINTQQGNEDQLTLINKDITALREVLVSIQDQMIKMTGQITITHQKINILMEKSLCIGQGVNEISDATTQDGSCFITMSQTSGEKTIMTPGKMSFSEAVTNTPVNPTLNVKPTPAPRRTINRNSNTPNKPKESESQYEKPKLPQTKNEQQTDKPGKYPISKSTATTTKSIARTTKSTAPTTKSGKYPISKYTATTTKSTAPTTKSGNRILILGDSILSGVNQKGLYRHVTIQPFPGATVETIWNKIVMYNLVQFKSVVIYVGGNDAARSRDPDMEYFEEKYDQLIKYIKTQNPSCDIYLCNMCPRGDAEINRTNEVIKNLSTVHETAYIDVLNGFYDKQNELRSYFYGERDWIHLSPSGIKRLLGTINSHIHIVDNFKTISAVPNSSKHDQKKTKPQKKQQNFIHRQTESCGNEESYQWRQDQDFVTNTKQTTSERCIKCGLRNHETEDCWHKVQVRCFLCKFYGHKDSDCWNR